MARDEDTSQSPNTTPNSAGAFLVVTAIIVLVIATVPGVACAAIVGVLGVEYRRVRTSRLMLAALIALVIAVIAAGFSTGQWAAWSTSFTAATWGSGLMPDPGNVSGILHWAATHTDASWPMIIATQVGFGTPVGLFLAGGYSAYRARSRRLLNSVEGDDFSSLRPVGFLDRAREARVRNRIESGYYLQEKQP